MGTITFRLESDDAGAVRGFLRLTDAQRKAEMQALKVGRASKKVGGDAKAGADSAESSLVRMATNFVSIAAAIGLAKKAQQELNEERRRGAEGIKEAEFSYAKLGQVATSEADLRHLIAESEKSRHETGMTAREAGDLQFSLRSMGADPDREFFASLYQATGQQPLAVAEGAKTLVAAMGTKEVGTVRQAANKLLVASRASKTSVEKLGPAAAIPAQQAKMAGASDEELLASMASMTAGLGTGESAANLAGTQLASLSTALVKLGMGGKGILAGVEQIEKLGLSDAALMEKLGRKEAVSGFKLISENKAEIRKLMVEIGREQTLGPGKGYADRMLEMMRSVSRLSIPQEGRISEQQLKQAEETAGGDEIQREIEVNRAMKRAWERGASGPSRIFTRSVLGAEQYFGQSPEGIAASAQGLAGTRPSTIPDAPLQWLVDWWNAGPVAHLQRGGAPAPVAPPVHADAQPSFRGHGAGGGWGDDGADKPGTVINHYGDNYNLGDRADMTQRTKEAETVGAVQ